MQEGPNLKTQNTLVYVPYKIYTLLIMPISLYMIRGLLQCNLLIYLEVHKIHHWLFKNYYYYYYLVMYSNV